MLYWSKSKPKKPGWYWVKAGGLLCISYYGVDIVEILNDDGSRSTIEYAGPIPKPFNKKDQSP